MSLIYLHFIIQILILLYLTYFLFNILSLIIIFYNNIYYFKHDELELKFRFIFVFDIVIQKYYLFIKVLH